jgi:hypothetical protein
MVAPWIGFCVVARAHPLFSVGLLAQEYAVVQRRRREIGAVAYSLCFELVRGASVSPTIRD